jgi:hypothetical protein
VEILRLVLIVFFFIVVGISLVSRNYLKAIFAMTIVLWLQH